MRSVLAAALLFTTYALAGAQTTASPNLRTLFVEDQRDRGVPLADDAVHTLSAEEAAKPPKYDGLEVVHRDAGRRAVAKTLLAQGSITGEGFYYAAFLFQHGQDPADYLFAHILAIEAIELGYSKAKWISAATLDRYLQSIGQKQVFGTQYLDEKYAYYLQHRNDADWKDKIKTIGSGKTLDPYDTQMIPDSIRADFCVPALAVQQQYIQAVRAGRSEDLPRVKDCGR